MIVTHLPKLDAMIIVFCVGKDERKRMRLTRIIESILFVVTFFALLMLSHAAGSPEWITWLTFMSGVYWGGHLSEDNKARDKII